MTQAEIRILVCSVSANIGSPCTCCLKFYSSRSKNTLQGTIGSRLTGTRYVGSYYIPIGGLLLLVTGTDLRNIRVFQDLKPIVADNGSPQSSTGRPIAYCTYFAEHDEKGRYRSTIFHVNPKNDSALHTLFEGIDRRNRYRSLLPRTHWSKK